MLPVIKICPCHECEVCVSTGITPNVFERSPDVYIIYSDKLENKMVMIDSVAKISSIESTTIRVARGYCGKHIRQALIDNYDVLFPDVPKTISDDILFGDLTQQITSYVEAEYKMKMVSKVLENADMC